MNPSTDTDNSQRYFKLDFNLHFDEAIKDLRSIKNRPIHKNSHNYNILKALFNGSVLDGYARKPLDNHGNQIHNVQVRVSELIHKFRIEISKQTVADTAIVEYRIDKGSNNE